MSRLYLTQVANAKINLFVFTSH